MKHIITISYDSVKSLDVHSEQMIRDVITATLTAEKFDDIAEVSVTLVNEAEIQRLNKLYRDKDVPTDVLSFVQYTDEGFDAYEDDPVFIGDIVLCYDVAVRQADEFGHAISREIGYLVCHSCLHLLGYDHIKPEDKIEMRGREKIIMSSLDMTRT